MSGDETPPAAAAPLTAEEAVALQQKMRDQLFAVYQSMTRRQRRAWKRKIAKKKNPRLKF